MAVVLSSFMIWGAISEVKKITIPSFHEKKQVTLKEIKATKDLKKDENITKNKQHILLSHPRKDSHSMSIAHFQKKMRNNFNKKFNSISTLIASEQQKIRQLRERKSIELGSRRKEIFELRHRLLYGNLDRKQRMLVNKELSRAEQDLKIVNSMINMRIHSIEREINQVKFSASLGDH